jgi:hypothetical protein
MRPILSGTKSKGAASTYIVPDPIVISLLLRVGSKKDQKNQTVACEFIKGAFLWCVVEASIKQTRGSLGGREKMR